MSPRAEGGGTRSSRRYDGIAHKLGGPMTEEEWLTAADPRVMLEFLRGKVSPRKWRLHSCGCCRLVWDRLVDRASREAVLFSEAFADGQGTEEQLWEHEYWAEGAIYGFDMKEERYRRERNGILKGWRPAEDAVESDGVITLDGSWISYRSARIAAAAVELAARLHDDFPSRVDPSILSVPIVRDIFSNPFRPVVVDPAWLTPAVCSIAARIYEDRAFDRLPVLADALEEAGCMNADVLLPCRTPGEHVRGCWVVDLVLGKS